MARDLDSLRGRRVLVLASTGGHLAQAVRWADKLGFSNESTFVTFKSPQSASLMSGRSVRYIPYIPPRGWRQIWDAARLLLRDPGIAGHDAIFSSGAGIALLGPVLQAVVRGPFFYVESVSRFAGPSLTGRILSGVPCVRRYAQHPGYSRRWKQASSLLDEYVVVDDPLLDDATLRVVVTLGTIRPYEFRRAVTLVEPALRESDNVFWQLGVTNASPVVGEVYDFVPTQTLDEAIECADVVVTHGGVGSILSLLDRGKVPLVVWRQASLNEHVDDHQRQVTEALATRGLVVNVTTPLTREDLVNAAQRRTIVRRDPGDD